MTLRIGDIAPDFEAETTEPGAMAKLTVSSWKSPKPYLRIVRQLH